MLHNYQRKDLAGDGMYLLKLVAILILFSTISLAEDEVPATTKMPSQTDSAGDAEFIAILEKMKNNRQQLYSGKFTIVAKVSKVITKSGKPPEKPTTADWSADGIFDTRYDCFRMIFWDRPTLPTDEDLKDQEATLTCLLEGARAVFTPKDPNLMMAENAESHVYLTTTQNPIDPRSVGLMPLSMSGLLEKDIKLVQERYLPVGDVKIQRSGKNLVTTEFYANGYRKRITSIDKKTFAIVKSDYSRGGPGDDGEYIESLVNWEEEIGWMERDGVSIPVWIKTIDRDRTHIMRDGDYAVNDQGEYLVDTEVVETRYEFDWQEVNVDYPSSIADYQNFGLPVGTTVFRQEGRGFVLVDRIKEPLQAVIQRVEAAPVATKSPLQWWIMLGGVVAAVVFFIRRRRALG